MMRKCEKNTCPAGIATQDPRLRAKFAGKPEYVTRLFTYLAEDIRALLAELGFRRLTDVIGRVDLLDVDEAVLGWKAKGLDLSPLLAPAKKKDENTKVSCCIAQDHGLDDILDRRLIRLAERVLLDSGPQTIEASIMNTDRAVGTMLSHHITTRWGAAGLRDGALLVKLTGTAGQSFGAWLTAGVTLELEGDANDYVGKGLSGGRIIVYPPRDSNFLPEENILIGNVALYGATSGQAFFRGMAAERFCVRNSGAEVVVEGVGDHGCEYMTGGRVVVIGPTGRNFAAGMSGGIAYVWDRDGDFRSKVNKGMVELSGLEGDKDEELILRLLDSHVSHTRSMIGQRILADWKKEKTRFVKVVSPEYRAILEGSADRELEVVHG